MFREVTLSSETLVSTKFGNGEKSFVRYRGGQSGDVTRTLFHLVLSCASDVVIRRSDLVASVSG